MALQKILFQDPILVFYIDTAHCLILHDRSSVHRVRWTEIAIQIVVPDLHGTVDCTPITVLSSLAPEGQILGSHSKPILAVQCLEPRLLDALVGKHLQTPQVKSHAGAA